MDFAETKWARKGKTLQENNLDAFRKKITAIIANECGKLRRTHQESFECKKEWLQKSNLYI
jgi:hypothetical protein